MESRFSEEIFPIKEVSLISAKDKNIRHGHISTLHLWWARRPLASSRAMNYAALIPYSNHAEDIKKEKEFIIKLSKWENSLNFTLLEESFKKILNMNGGKRPKVLDPFAGGGSIPLEAMRLGCETYANEYNPVAMLILKCTLEFPHMFSKKNNISDMNFISESYNQLLEDISKWGKWVTDEVKKEIGQYFPEPGNEKIIGYLWAKTIQCQNPSCNKQIPLMRQFWICNRAKKKISLYPLVSKEEVEFQIVDVKDKLLSNFNPNKGTVSKAIATCLICGSVVDAKTTRHLFSTQQSKEKLVAIIYQEKNTNGKRYRISTENDMIAFDKAKNYLQQKRELLRQKWGLDPIPNEPLKRVPISFGIINVWIYGMDTWGHLFNPRQKLALITFTQKVREAYLEMIKQKYNEQYATAITTYLAIILDRLADKNSNLVVYDSTTENIKHVFQRQALGMVWDYAELNPFTDVGWTDMQEWVKKAVSHCMKLNLINKPPLPKITQNSATNLPYPNDYFDAVFADPPYYDYVPYSYISDFFYVWLKRAIGDLYPELFSTLLTPKSKEIVAYSNISGFNDGKSYFEHMLKMSFKEISRVLKPNGISVIVYAHKSTEGWESLINSLLESGLVVTAAWPINTEMKERLRATDSAALASSIYMIARKYEKIRVGFYRDIKNGLKQHLTIELDKLWMEGISGADFLVSAIGSAIEVFGKYEKIIDDEENEIKTDKLLEEIRRIVTNYAIKQVMHNGFSVEISQTTRFYLLWRWAYGESKIPFDDARKLAQSIGLNLIYNLNKGLIKKHKESNKILISVLGPHERNKDFVDNELIDILHKVLLLWSNGKNKEMMTVLKESGYGDNDVFYRVAQAISESLSKESKEKKWLEGFLAGRTRILNEIRKGSDQRRLFE